MKNCPRNLLKKKKKNSFFSYLFSIKTEDAWKKKQENNEQWVEANHTQIKTPHLSKLNTNFNQNDSLGWKEREREWETTTQQKKRTKKKKVTDGARSKKKKKKKKKKKNVTLFRLKLPARIAVPFPHK